MQHQSLARASPSLLGIGHLSLLRLRSAGYGFRTGGVQGVNQFAKHRSVDAVVIEQGAENCGEEENLDHRGLDTSP